MVPRKVSAATRSANDGRPHTGYLSPYTGLAPSSSTELGGRPFDRLIVRRPPKSVAPEYGVSAQEAENVLLDQPVEPRYPKLKVIPAVTLMSGTFGHEPREIDL